jgi:hypothetical protein
MVDPPSASSWDMEKLHGDTRGALHIQALWRVYQRMVEPAHFSLPENDDFNISHRDLFRDT